MCMKPDHSALLICIAAALLIVGTAVFLSLWINIRVGILSGAGAFAVLIVFTVLARLRMR